MQIKFIKRNYVEILVAEAFWALYKAGFGRAIMMSSCRGKIMVKRSVLSFDNNAWFGGKALNK